MERFGEEFTPAHHGSDFAAGHRLAVKSKMPESTMSAAEEPSGSRPRVLFVSHETTLSGAPIQLVHLARLAEKGGMAVCVAAPGRRADLGDARPRPDRDSGGADAADRSRARKVARTCRDFDVIVANTIASWPAVRAAHLEKRPGPLVFARNACGRAPVRAIPEIRSAMKMANLLVTPTRQTARVYEGLTLAPIEVVPYGIPSPPVLSGAKNDSICFPDPRLASSRAKARTFWSRPFTNWTRRCVGGVCSKWRGGFWTWSFSKLAKCAVAGLDNVAIDRCARSFGAPTLLNETDAVVLPSRDETMPIVILEAMGLGQGGHQHGRRRSAGVDAGRIERIGRREGESRRAGRALAACVGRARISATAR